MEITERSVKETTGKKQSFGFFFNSVQMEMQFRHPSEKPDGDL